MGRAPPKAVPPFILMTYNASVCICDACSLCLVLFGRRFLSRCICAREFFILYIFSLWFSFFFKSLCKSATSEYWLMHYEIVFAARIVCLFDVMLVHYFYFILFFFSCSVFFYISCCLHLVRWYFQSQLCRKYVTTKGLKKKIIHSSGIYRIGYNFIFLSGDMTANWIHNLRVVRNSSTMHFVFYLF